MKHLIMCAFIFSLFSSSCHAMYWLPVHSEDERLVAVPLLFSTLGIWVDKSVSFSGGAEERQRLLSSILFYADAITGVDQAYRHAAIRDRATGRFGRAARHCHRMKDITSC